MLHLQNVGVFQGEQECILFYRCIEIQIHPDINLHEGWQHYIQFTPHFYAKKEGGTEIRKDQRLHILNIDSFGGLSVKDSQK